MAKRKDDNIDWERTRDAWAEKARRNQEAWGEVGEKTQRTHGGRAQESYESLDDRDHRWGSRKN